MLTQRADRECRNTEVRAAVVVGWGAGRRQNGVSLSDPFERDAMRRREFIMGLGGAAAWPVMGRAQQVPTAMRRIGVLVNNAEDAPGVQTQIAAFRRSLGQFGWMEGRNIQIELRFSANNYELLPRLAQELVALHEHASRARPPM
jgi:hypothetical protein